MSKMLVSSGSSAIGVNIHLAINTIGGDFGMEVNTVSLDSTSLFFVFWFFFFFVRGEDAITRSWVVCRDAAMEIEGNKY